MILAETGIRAGEICPLRAEDLDLENAVIHVRQSVWRQTANGEIPQGQSSVSDFARIGRPSEDAPANMATDSSSLVFASSNDTPWDHSLVRKRKFHPILKKLGIPQCGFHAFRHGNATLLDQIGAPPAVRLNRLGHAEAQTTMNYTHAITLDKLRTAEELGKILHVDARNEQRELLAVKPLTLKIQ